MSSALERIRQIRTQQEAQQKISESEDAERQARRNRTLVEERTQKQARIRHVTEVSQRIFTETNIIGQLKDIERHECSSFPKHAVVVNYGEEKASATLAWGKAFSVKNNEIEDEVPLFILKGLAKREYFYVNVIINPETEYIYIYQTKDLKYLLIFGKEILK